MTLNDPIVHFQVNTYFSAVDLISSEINRRFLGDCEDNKQQIGLLNDFSLLTKKE